MNTILIYLIGIILHLNVITSIAVLKSTIEELIKEGEQQWV